MDDEPIETKFHDLNGMEYKDMKVSDDYQWVRVTYLKEDQEKEKTFHVLAKKIEPFQKLLQCIGVGT